jgi:hypothetical protein
MSENGIINIKDSDSTISQPPTGYTKLATKSDGVYYRTSTGAEQKFLDSAGLALKEDVITPGSTGQYWRGDKTWQTLDKIAVGLNNVPNVDATNPANITQDSTHRFVTDTEKGTWNGKQDALGFTPENTANKGVANGYAPLDASSYIPIANTNPNGWQPWGIGFETTPTVTSNGNGTAAITAADVSFYTDLTKREVTTLAVGPTASVALTDLVTNYVVADRDTLTYVSLSAFTDVDYDRYVPLCEIYRSGNNLHTQMIQLDGRRMPENEHKRTIHTDRYARESGLDGMAVDSSLKLTSNVGVVYAALNEYSIPAISPASRGFHSYHVSGVWTTSSALDKALNNTQYDNGTDLVTLTDTYWTINWIFRGIELQDHWYYVLGNAEYATLDLAKAANFVATLPEIITSHALLIGRVIIQKGTTSNFTIESAFDTVFSGASPVTVHNSLSGIQGGSVTERYHLTSAQHAVATQAATASLDGYLDKDDFATFAAKVNRSGDTMTGELVMDNAGIQLDNNLANPAHSEGRMFYDRVEHAISYYNDVTGVTVNVGQETVARVLNQTGSQINNGQVVYISSASGGRPRVSLAKADAHATSRFVYVATQNIANGDIGYVTSEGIVHDLNTNAYNVGDILYLSAATAGELTNVEPTGTNLIVPVGVVVDKDPSVGTIFVRPDGPHHALVPVLEGGTGASTAADARTNLSAEYTGNKGAASGYCGLDAGSKIAIGNIPTGTTNTTVCIGNDSRLSDARTPTAHATTHVTGGSDVIANAVASGNAGLMSGADKAKLDSLGGFSETKIVTTLQSSTSVTYANVTELVSSSLSTGKYRFDFVGLSQSTAVGTGRGLRIAAGSATIGICFARWLLGLAANGSAATFQYEQLTATTNVVGSATLAANTDTVDQAMGYFEVTVAGTVAIQLRSETAGTGVSIRPGSFVTITKIG